MVRMCVRRSRENKCTRNFRLYLPVPRLPVLPTNLPLPSRFTVTEHRLCLLVVLVNALWWWGAWRSFCVRAMNEVMRRWVHNAMYEMAMGPC